MLLGSIDREPESPWFWPMALYASEVSH